MWLQDQRVPVPFDLPGGLIFLFCKVRARLVHLSHLLELQDPIHFVGDISPLSFVDNLFLREVMGNGYPWGNLTEAMA